MKDNDTDLGEQNKVARKNKKNEKRAEKEASPEKRVKEIESAAKKTEKRDRKTRKSEDKTELKRRKDEADSARKAEKADLKAEKKRLASLEAPELENKSPEAAQSGEIGERRLVITEKELRRRRSSAANQISYSRGEEWVNRISHLVGAGLAGIGSVLALVKVCLSGVGALGIVSIALFSFSMIVLYVMSTLYHWQPVGKRRRAVFRRFDHCSIAILIAGTYAPFMLIGMYSGGGSASVWAIVLASVVLGMVALTCVFNGINVNKFKVYSLISYVIMGWACVIRIDLLVHIIAWQAFVLLLAGGVVYTAGIIFYRMKSIKYNHAIWHFFVLGGTILHYAAIYFYIIP